MNESDEIQARGYEFNAAENPVLGETAGLARAWGIISVVLGIIASLGSFSPSRGGDPVDAVTLVEGIGTIVVGVFFIRTAGSLKSVVTTEGNDIKHMMDAMKSLRTVFLIEMVVLGIAIASGIASVA